MRRVVLATLGVNRALDCDHERTPDTWRLAQMNERAVYGEPRTGGTPPSALEPRKADPPSGLSRSCSGADCVALTDRSSRRSCLVGESMSSNDTFAACADTPEAEVEQSHATIPAPRPLLPPDEGGSVEDSSLPRRPGVGESRRSPRSKTWHALPERLLRAVPSPSDEEGSADGPVSGIRPTDRARAEAEVERFGPLSRVLRLAASPDVLRRMRFDATTRALLSAVDGKSSFEGLLRLCATPHVQALRVFLALRFLGIIEFEEPGGA